MSSRSRSIPGPVRAFALFGLPALLVLAGLVLPLITGEETLILRDVLQIHLMLKVPLVEAMRAAAFPLIDPLRMGGQPLAGNPNAVPFYPDNLLYLVAPLFWAFNAHFWIHLLLAPPAAYWMGRAWGLTRPAAWATGVTYGASGFMLSQLNFYNLVAGAALAPALVAAVLAAAEGRRRLAAAAGLLWALLLLSGDPLTALMAAALAGTALLIRFGPRLRPGRLGSLIVALVAGTLVALPQIVEFLRILPWTARGHGGSTTARLVAGVWQPEQALEWLVPLAFGRFDLVAEGGLWGARFFAGHQPIFLSLYPGLLALALVAASGLPRSRSAWWAWSMAAVGTFLALGGHNPLGRWLFELSWAQTFRYPIKLWLLVAVGAALLCGLGFDRVFGDAMGRGESARLRPIARPLAVLGAALVTIGGFVVFQGPRFESLVLALAPSSWSPMMAAVERQRWIASLVVSIAVLVALGAALLLARTRPVFAGALLLLVHSAGQVVLLQSLATSDEVAFYREPPPALAAIPEDGTVAHGEHMHLFGERETPPFPDSRYFWGTRHFYLSLAPFAGVLWGVPYELNLSPEGLESYLGRVAHGAVANAGGDAARVRALSRWGVDALVIAGPLEGPEPPDPAWAEPAGRFEGTASPVDVYRLPRVAPEVLFAETVLEVPHLNAAWDLFIHPAFDPERLAVLPGPEDAPPPPLPRGDGPPDAGLRVLRDGPEEVVVELDAAAAGALVVQRAHLPIWRATVDGAPAEIEPANLYRMGVRVPSGSHRVRLWVDRRPLIASSIAALVGLVGLGSLAVAGSRKRGGCPDRLAGDPLRR